MLDRENRRTLEAIVVLTIMIFVISGLLHIGGFLK